MDSVLTKLSFALPSDLLSELDSIHPSKFRAPTDSGPPEAFIAGNATETMKRLFTYWIILEERRGEALQDVKRTSLARHREDVIRFATKVYLTDLMQRSVHLALKYEIWRFFSETVGREIGIDDRWRVFYGDLEPIQIY